MLRYLLNPRTAAALGLAALLVGVTVQADVIILKDGFTIHGVKTVKEKDVILDDGTGAAIITTKVNGMTAEDDGPRWVVFPSSALQVADVSESNRFRDFAAYTQDRVKGTEKLPSTAVRPTTVKDWDFKEWTKVVRYEDSTDARIVHTVRLQITVITPYYLRIGSSSHKLARYFLTQEWGPELIRKFIVHHPDLAEPAGKPDPARREKLIRFWIQADWLDEADKDLEALVTALPAEKARHARLKSEVNGLRAEKLLAEIELAHNAGRNQWAVQALDALPKAFPKEDIPRAVAMRVAALRAEYDKRTEEFDRAGRHLSALAAQVNPAANGWLVTAATAVRDEMHLDTLARLDMFVTLADRAAKDAQAGRRPSHSPEELLASAITGWHLGKVAAEAKVDTAYKVWMTRQMALEYLRTPTLGNRQQVLQKYLGSPTALKYDELEKLVSLLPPPEAPAQLPKGIEAFQLPPTVQYPAGVSFQIRLPDEYQPGRSYPLLVLLPDAADKETPPAGQMRAMLDLFGDRPSRHGYIVAVAQWWDPERPVYRYSKEEQGAVMQLLSHLRRAYQVDSDRIFLWGNGQGGSLALDMGGSHPDQFAGIVPVNPSVRSKLYIPCEYWVNFFQLPVYLIMGDKFGPSVNAIRMISERWMPKGFPTLVVSYKGRGPEWFSGELAYAFDWMGRKRRADPGKTVGPPRFSGRTSAAGFSSVRFTDDRFHWLSSSEIKPERVIDWESPNLTVPMKFSAEVTSGNTIRAKVFGVRQVTVWFGKGMVDYTKPVTVYVANERASRKQTKPVTPEVAVLMEDLYERADRQRPYFARMDFDMP